MITMTNIDARHAFINGYVDAMLWANLDADDDITRDELSESMSDGGDQSARELLTWDAIKELVRDARAFVEEQESNLASAAGKREWDYLGHDFALTRNHHGVGFWDRGLGDLGDTLTDASHVWGEANLYFDGEAIHHN